MTDGRPRVVIVLALGFGSAAGCGPEPRPAHVTSGYYRAARIDSEDSCGMGAVWSTEVAAAYSREGFAALYADVVPIRADDELVEIPEPTVQPPEGEAWRMRALERTRESYDLEAAFAISFCVDFRYTWSAVPLDEQTIHVTREGTGCGPGDGDSRICDNRIDIEYELVDACEEPCQLVDDGATRFPGVDLDDLILKDSRCEC